MDYSQLSDFEINKAVAISVGFPCYYGDGSYTNNLGLRGAIVKGENDSGLFMVGEFNPCNNPADAWPIIVDNEISLNSYGSAWEASFEHDAPIGAFGTDETVTSGYEHRNPLRAAMIAFLMKQEQANA